MKKSLSSILTASQSVALWRKNNPEKSRQQWLRAWERLKSDPNKHAQYLRKRKIWDKKFRQIHGNSPTIPYNQKTIGQKKRKMFTDRQWRLRNKKKVSLIYKVSKDKAMYGGNREKAILRDGEKCVKCEITREQHYRKYKRDITVDHINRLGKGVSRDKKDNRLENLMTLCISCHMRKDGVKNRYSQQG